VNLLFSALVVRLGLFFFASNCLRYNHTCCLSTITRSGTSYSYEE